MGYVVTKIKNTSVSLGVVKDVLVELNRHYAFKG